MPKWCKTKATRVLCFFSIYHQPLRTQVNRTAGDRINTARERMRIKNYLLVALGALALVGCTATKTIPTQSSSTTYKVGDGFNQNGVTGIVVKVDASGKHGLVMSLKSSKEKWTSDSKFDYETNAFYEDDGEKNMEAISKYVASGKASWTDFPLMNWARSLGQGWYIPAKKEALEIWSNMNGEADSYKWNPWLFFDLIHSNNKFEEFDKMQRKYGGDKLVNTSYFGDKHPYIWMTSTEGEGGTVYGVQFDLTSVKGAFTLGLPGTTTKFAAGIYKKRPPMMTGFKSRAVHKF